MMVPANYGFSPFSFSAYYWFGRAGNFSKYIIGSAVVEAAFLSGYNVTPLGSNLPQRSVAIYSTPAVVTRFSAPPSTNANFVALWGKNRAVFPFGIPVEQVHGRPANGG